jgi:hypothetical protein
MWARDFVGAVSREVVETISTPILVLPGADLVHPRDIALELAELAPSATLLDHWNTSAPDLERATAAIRAFLEDHARPTMSGRATRS